MLRGPRLTIASCVLLACSTEPPAPQISHEPDACEARVDREIACADEDRDMAELTRERSLGDCALRRRDPGRDAAELACAQRADCGEFRRCMHELAARAQAATVMPVVAAALASGTDVPAALRECETAHGIGDAELTRQCDVLLGREIGRLSKTVEALRDAGKGGDVVVTHDGDVWSLEVVEECRTLPLLAERRSKEAFARAVKLCDEAAVAPHAVKAIDEANKALADRSWKLVPYMPPGCSHVFDELVRLATPWAEQRLRQVVDVCHVAAARRSLAYTVRKMKLCPLEYEQVVAAVKRFAIEDRELAASLAEASKVCPTK